jgi:dihydrolipoamide dehydrogenase
MVMGEFTQETEVLVIGGGPGGYAAAFRAADLGLKVTMVDMEPRAGGVCLFRGCIPSKALLYVSELLHDVKGAEKMGLDFNQPQVDLVRLREWKEQVVDKLAKGLAQLSKKRKVEYIQARAGFEDSHHVRLYDTESEVSHISFKHAIIATGSRPIPLPGTEFKPGSRIMDSGGALTLEEIPQRLLVVGGGYVGVELGSVYGSLGSRVTLVEMTDGIMPGADRDLVENLAKRLEDLFETMYFNSKVTSAEEDEAGVKVTLEGDADGTTQTFDRLLVAIGRRPNSEGLGLENTKVEVDEHGFVVVDEQQRTAQKNLYAIGDVVGGVMLAHKAMYEGKVAAEVIAGEPSAFDARAIPAVVYTDPQLAWCGLTEDNARRENRSVRISRFPWIASGRAASMGVSSGMTKIIVDAETERVLGMGIVGREAGEMISEGVLAVEMGALAEDLALSIHPHPTLSETEEEAAGAFLGSSTHILPKEEVIGSED